MSVTKKDTSVFAHHVARCSCPYTLATIGSNGCSRSVTPVPIFAVEP